MRVAMRMYERMGFVRAPELDFHPDENVTVKGLSAQSRCYKTAPLTSLPATASSASRTMVTIWSTSFSLMTSEGKSQNIADGAGEEATLDAGLAYLVAQIGRGFGSPYRPRIQLRTSTPGRAHRPP